MFSDQPLKNSKEDLFDRENFSNRIAQIIAKRTERESIVIGIHAPWGEGKTSVLNMIIEKIDDYVQKKDGKILDGHIVLVKFNPWRFTDENQLLTNFYSALGTALEKSVSNSRKKIGEKLKKYAWMTSPIEAIKFNLAGVIESRVDAKETLEKIGEELSKGNVEDLKRDIEKILDEENRKVIILMDDIDRLDKEEIQSIFRLVKLSADFSNTIYILSFDIERVSEALAEKYGSKEAGRSFLEKIIQLSLPLPPLTPLQLIHLTFDNINKLLAENNITPPIKEDNEWSYFFFSTFGSYLKSPRLVKKFINNLWFSLPEVKNELNIFDLQTIEAVHIFLPELYEIIRSNRNVFLLEPSHPYMREFEEKEHIEKLKNIVDSFPEQKQKIIKKIVKKLFPQSSAAFSEPSYGHGFYDEWTRQKRIASPKYFQRYFNFGVSSDDISDIELNRYISNLTSKTDAQNAAGIKEFIKNNKEELFLQKISLLVNDLDESKTIKLAKAIGLSGNLFPKGTQDSLMFTENPFSNAARVLRHILENIEDKEKQLEIAKELASIISPLDFAHEFFLFAKYIDRVSIEEKNEEQLTVLAKTILDVTVERTENEVKQKKLEIEYPQTSTRLYNAWLFEKPENVKKYFRKRFAKNPKEVDELVNSFWKQHYDVNNVAQIWGFDFVISAIEKTHPKLKLMELPNYERKSHYLPHSEIAFLGYFLSIAKLNKSNSDKSE